MKLASYACDPSKTIGRLHKEKLGADKNPFLKDRERIIHSVAFRRLEYKTQDFINHMGDHYRTRLTHSLEVSQVARTAARELSLNEDLAEAIALSHDLGHPPFGHAGENGLNKAAAKFGGFDHNLQTVKILTNLEQRYAEFDGLNLTWETIEGAIKHNGPLKGRGLLSKQKKPSQFIVQLADTMDLKLELYPSLEAQVSSLSDDIAYCNHDIDDGIRAGMIALEDLKGIPVIKDIYQHVMSLYPNVSDSRKLNEIIRRLVRCMIADLVKESSANIVRLKIKTPDDARRAKVQTITFSKEVEQMRNELKNLLMVKVYRNFKVNRMSIKAEQIVGDLFKTLLEEPNCLPTEWYHKIKGLKSKQEQACIVIDYISGMTDRYAIKEHKRLFNPEYF